MSETITDPTPSRDHLPTASKLTPWPPSWEPAAVVVDLDGTLVDTEQQWVQAQDAYLQSHGATMDEHTRREITGRSAQTVVAAIARIVGKDPEVVVGELLAQHRADLDRPLTPLPGALEILRAIAERKPVAIASNSPRDLLDKKVHSLGIDDVADHTVAIEDVAQPKPAPDMYRRGAELLGADPADCLAIEDSETGAESALAAGLQLISVPVIPGQDPRSHHRLTDLTDPELHRWVESWTRTR